MKILLLFVCGLLYFNTCEAQRVSYNDLVFVLNHNVAAAEDYLSNKGFEFNKVDTVTNELVETSYSFAKNSSHDKSYLNIEKKSIKDIFYCVSIYTTFQSDYLPIKASIKKLGYKLTETSVKNGNFVTSYKKGVMEIKFSLHHIKEIDTTDYYITITNTDKEKAAWKLSTD